MIRTVSLLHKLFQFQVTLSVGTDKKYLIECPDKLKCSETVVSMSRKCFISNLCFFNL